MPMRLWWGRVDKRVFKPMALRIGTWQVGRHGSCPTGMSATCCRVGDGSCASFSTGSPIVCRWISAVPAPTVDALVLS